MSGLIVGQEKLVSLKLFIEILVSIIGLVGIFNLQIPMFLIYFILALLSIFIFYLIYTEIIKPNFLCQTCGGSGKNECWYCYGKGVLKPRIETMQVGCGISKLSKNATGKFQIETTPTEIRGYYHLGNVQFTVEVKDKILHKTRGKESFDINLTNLDNHNLGCITIKLIDISDIKQKINAEPKSEHFELRFSFNNLDKGEICGNCNGTRKKECVQCHGKRFKFLI